MIRRPLECRSKPERESVSERSQMSCKLESRLASHGVL